MHVCMYVCMTLSFLGWSPDSPWAESNEGDMAPHALPLPELSLHLPLWQEPHLEAAGGLEWRHREKGTVFEVLFKAHLEATN